jgi:hypothetical protein
MNISTYFDTTEITVFIKEDEIDYSKVNDKNTELLYKLDLEVKLNSEILSKLEEQLKLNQDLQTKLDEQLKLNKELHEKYYSLI